MDQKGGKEKRRSPVSRNEHYRTLLEQALKNQILFRYVLNKVALSLAGKLRQCLSQTMKRGTAS